MKLENYEIKLNLNVYQIGLLTGLLYKHLHEHYDLKEILNQLEPTITEVYKNSGVNFKNE